MLPGMSPTALVAMRQWQQLHTSHAAACDILHSTLQSSSIMACYRAYMRKRPQHYQPLCSTPTTPGISKQKLRTLGGRGFPIAQHALHIPH